MRIFYYDFTGTHSALLAAGLHLNVLPRHRAAVAQEFERLGVYGRDGIASVTGPIYVGTDTRGHQIYTLGLSTEDKVMVKAVHSLLNLFNIGAQQYLLVDTIKVSGKLAEVGAYLTYFARTKRYGQAFIDHGLESNYMNLVKLVEDTEQFLMTL